MRPSFRSKAGLALVAMLGATAAQAEEKRDCFYARNISSWAAQDDTTVNLRVNVRDFFQLKLLAPCNNINWTERIGIEREHRFGDVVDRADADIA